MGNKVRVNFEFELKTAPTILFNYLSTPSGLSEWFADDVDIRDNVYTFKWGSSETLAHMVKINPGKSIRFVWEGDEEEEYFELEIQIDEITADLALMVTDHCEKGEEDETFRLWESQIHDLKIALGA